MERWHQNNKIRPKARGERGASAVEFAIILPILVMMVFAAIDFGRLFHARLIMTNLAREGANLASRSLHLQSDSYSPTELLDLLQAGSNPLNMVRNGRIYIWRIKAGDSNTNNNPDIDSGLSAYRGALNVASSIGRGKPNLGLSPTLYSHLVYNSGNKTADIGDITVVEVFYEYRPITPVVMSNKVLSSRAVF